MTSERKTGKEPAEQGKKQPARISGDRNAKEASDARAETVRGIMKRNRESGEG